MRFWRRIASNKSIKIFALFVQSRLIPTTVGMYAAFNRELAQKVDLYLAARNPALEQSHRELIATISVEVACALDILALSGDRDFQHRVLAETKQLTIAYLQPSPSRFQKIIF